MMKRSFYFFLFLSFFTLNGPAFSAEADIVKSFSDALIAGDNAKMDAIVAENKDAIPSAVGLILTDAESSQLSKEDRESRYYMAEILATRYRDKYGDVKPLKEARKKHFDSMLSAPVRPAEADGVYSVEFPKAEGGVKNIFKPDNIVIKRGETVRWVNRDDVAHVFSTMAFFGEGGVKSPSIAPGASWDYKFEKPGEYYLICYIHRGMLGKVTVEDTATPEPAKEPAKSEEPQKGAEPANPPIPANP